MATLMKIQSHKVNKQSSNRSITVNFFMEVDTVAKPSESVTTRTIDKNAEGVGWKITLLNELTTLLDATYTAKATELAQKNSELATIISEANTLNSNITGE